MVRDSTMVLQPTTRKQAMPTSTHFNSDPFAGPTDFDIWEKPSSQCTPQVARPRHLKS